jgi:hypothetical protein
MKMLVDTMKHRFFAFGCSFTQYEWPTWADILGKSFDEFQNWGRQGGGNQFIANSIIEAHLKNKIKPTDTVGVMWTNVCREDRYIRDSWATPGNIYTQQMYSEDWVKKFADVRGYLIRDLATIYSTEQFLKSIGCHYFFFSVVNILNSKQYDIVNDYELVKDLLPYYAPTLENIKPSVYDVVFDQDWWSRPFKNTIDLTPEEYHDLTKTGPNRPKIRQDAHPTPAEHLEYLDKVMPNKYVNLETRNWVTEADARLRNDQDYSTIWKPTKIERW